MDDPWGSPWAAPNESSSATLELPGRTLTRNRSFSTQSPWAADDDGFADWNSADPGLALPPTALAPSPSPGWSPWGADNALNSRASLGPGQPSPTLWPAAPSPGFQPLKTVSRRSSSRSLSLFRQPSPDPWAAEFSQNRISLPAAVHGSTDQLSVPALESHQEVPEPPAPTTPTPEPPTDKAKPAENHSHSPAPSRHSSLSDDSHRDDRPPESPITSMDEDAKDRPPITRRASAKVQELVHMYDDLARKRSQSLLTPDAASGRQRSGSRSTSIRSGRTDDASDFGDFEDAQDEDVMRSSKQPSVAGSPRRPVSRAGRLRSVSKSSIRTSSAPLSQPVPSPILEEVSTRFNDLREKFGPVKFGVQLDQVDKLFDVDKLDREQPSAKDYSLDAIDGIIKDSFSTVSERKTWYRISRPGTLRKHELGDDDNYRRVTWAGSKVRDDVTVTVRRWMEEGSYSGRPAVGGGPAVKSGGFNWDAKSKSEPLSFDQIFGKRKSVQPLKPAAAPLPRPLSLQPEPTGPGHSRNSSTSGKSLPPRSPLSIPEPPPGPAFGWSTGAHGTSTPASPRPSSQYARPSLDVSSTRSALSRTASVHEPESRSSVQLAPPTLATPAPALTIVDADDDDEEWGDMIASPAAESRPTRVLFDNSMNGSMASLHAQFTEAPPRRLGPRASASTSSLHAQFVEAPPPKPEATTVLDAVTSKLQETAQATPEEEPAAAPLDIWDFSAFESQPAAPTIPPTITSKPDFDFDTPLQSPNSSVPSRTGSPSSLPIPKPTPPQQHPRPPAPSAVPFRPQHGQQRSRSSLNLVRPSPLHNVITPKPAPPAETTVTKSVSFAQAGEDEDALSEEDAALVRKIVGGLPNLSYMLR